MLMATRTHIDFHRVEEKHAEIHKRLQNWAQWANGSEPRGVSPMFRLYRSTARARGAESSWNGVAVDGPDASRLHSGRSRKVVPAAGFAPALAPF